MKKIFFCLKLFSLTLITVPGFAFSKRVEPCRVHEPGNESKPIISKRPFGEIDGQQVYEYTLKNSKGMLVKVINYGAVITDIITPDKNGEMGSVVLGFDSLKSYRGPMNALMGATVGRVANRIANKKFTLDGKEYILSSNIHGGINGFNKKIWDITELAGKKEVALKLSYFSKDGEEGFPGNLKVTITYTLTNKNEFKINYTATTDKATPVVLTNHSYFNLSGSKNDMALNTEVKIYADQYLESDNAGIPTGNFIDVKESPFDFTSPREIGKRIGDTNDQLKRGNGYDVTFVLHNETGKLLPAASAYDPFSGRLMEVYSTEPGLVFYTGNYLSERIIGRGGRPFKKYGAFCFETQHYPDSPNQPKFPNCILRPDEKFNSTTVYKFSVRK